MMTPGLFPVVSVTCRQPMCRCGCPAKIKSVSEYCMVILSPYQEKGKKTGLGLGCLRKKTYLCFPKNVKNEDYADRQERYHHSHV